MTNASTGPGFRTDTVPPRLVYWGLQPAVLVLAYAAAANAIPGLGAFAAVGLVFVVLSIAEEIWPARRAWKQTWRDRAGCMAMFALSLIAMQVWQDLVYPRMLDEPFARVRAAVSQAWPSALPFVVQVLLAFLILQFMAYWLHRGQHRIGLLWRVTGHGVHHTYKRLNAINWNANHPLEAVTLIAPIALAEAVLGIGAPAQVAGILVIVSAACAHMNIRVNTQVISLLFTANTHHVHHHSSDFRESNTNYGCASTIWDRVFGTFEDADTAELGDLKTEPGIGRKLVLPFLAPGVDPR